MANKIILTSTDCPGMPDSDYPVTCFLKLNQEDIDNLTAIRTLLESHGLFSAELECHTGSFSDEFIDDTLSKDDLIQMMNENQARLELPYYLITQRGVQITAHQKNAGDSSLIRSKEVPFEELLDSCELFISE